MAVDAAIAQRGHAVPWQAVASGGLFLLLWQAGAMLGASRLFPGPAEVAAAMAKDAVDGPLLYHLGITLWRVAVSFALSMTIGTALGILLGRHAALDRWAYPWVLFFLNIPALVLIFLSYVWLGLTEAALFLAVALNKVPNVAVTLREGARSIDRAWLDLPRLYRFDARRHVLLPQLAPYLMAAARNGLGLIWKIVLVVELIGRSSGIGFQLQLYFQLFDVTRVLAYSAAFVLCLLLVEAAVLAPLDRRLRRWRG